MTHIEQTGQKPMEKYEPAKLLEPWSSKSQVFKDIYLFLRNGMCIERKIDDNGEGFYLFGYPDLSIGAMKYVRLTLNDLLDLGISARDVKRIRSGGEVAGLPVLITQG